MTPAELRTLIDNTPACTVPFAAGDDTAVAAILSAKTLPGYVPTLELGRWIYDLGVYAKASVVSAGPVPSGPQEQAFYGLCRTLMGMLRDLPDVNVLADSFQAGLAAFVGVGWITQEVAGQITALSANRTPLAGEIVTPDAVGEARKVGG